MLPNVSMSSYLVDQKSRRIIKLIYIQNHKINKKEVIDSQMFYNL